MNVQNSLRTLLTALMLTFSLCLVQAQPPADPGIDPGGGNMGVPIDGGLSVLVAATIGYAAKKRYDKRKEKAVAGTETNNADETVLN